MGHKNSWPYLCLITAVLAVCFGAAYHFYSSSQRVIHRDVNILQEQSELSMLESGMGTDSMNFLTELEIQDLIYEFQLQTALAEPLRREIFTLQIYDLIDELQNQHALAKLLSQNDDSVAMADENNDSPNEASFDEASFEHYPMPTLTTHENANAILVYDDTLATPEQKNISSPQPLAESESSSTDTTRDSNTDDLACRSSEDPCASKCDSCGSDLSDGWWEDDPWDYPVRLYLDHVEGRWLDNKQGYSSLGLFLGIPNLAGSFTPVIDVREHFFNNGRSAANLGLGFRVGNRIIFGANAFYDYRKAHRGSYHQVGAGIELLSNCWDLRVNGYWPVGETVGKSHVHVFDHFTNKKYVATCTELQGAMRGANAEIGRWMKRMNACSCFDLYFALGGHYYKAVKHEHHETYGGEARIASRIGRYLTLELAGGYDRLYKGMVQGRVTIAFPIFDPFCCAAKECCETACNDCSCVNPFALQPIRRQEIIVLDDESCCWSWNWDSPGH